MKHLLKELWRWSWILTLPVFIACIYWASLTIQNYVAFGIKYDTKHSRSFNPFLFKSGKDNFHYLLRAIQVSTTPHFKKETDNLGLNRISLYIPTSNIAKLNSNLPYSGMEYVKGNMLIGNDIERVKLRYRGDTILHWGGPKKSFRIKTNKRKLYQGMRKLNILAPKSNTILVNHTSYKLAEYFDLLTPRSDMVELIVNGEYRGVHVLVEQLEELTLRNNGKMPGDVYSGELFAKDRFKGASPFVFDHPGLWGKPAVNNHYEADSKKPLERLIKLINSAPSESIIKELNNLLDMNAWGRFSAYETLTQTRHFDETHNWRLYYDPWKQKFEPIIWDPLGWVSSHSFKYPIIADNSRTRLHNALYNSEEFIVAKHNAISNFFAKNNDDKFLLQFDELVNKVKPSLASDPFLLKSTEETFDLISRYRQRIESVFAASEKEFLPNESVFSYQNKGRGSYKIKLDGRQPINSLTLAYRDNLTNDLNAQITYYINEKPITRDISGALAISNSRVTINVPLIANFSNHLRTDVNAKVKEHSPSYFELEIKGISENNTLVEMVADRGGKRAEQGHAVDSIEVLSFTNNHNAVPDYPKANFSVWSGNIFIDEILTVNDEVLIEPGTTIHLTSGASVIFKKRVLAEGSPEKPIRFIANKVDQDPWGTIAIQGQGANGSRFTQCEFSSGSGYKGGLFEYSSMFSIHHVDDVIVDNCLFKDGKLVDDMVHAVYSNIIFKNSTFKNSLSDALDIDISKAIIENSLFLDSGNDAIDLMTSDAVVRNTVISNSGDKGVSVGEGSRLLAINNRINNNHIGIQSKDGSAAALFNVSLENNKEGIDAYKKNWRYNSGGYIYVYKSILVENEKTAGADKNSMVSIYDSSYDKSVSINTKRKKPKVIVDRLSTLNSITKPSKNQLIRDPNEVERMKGYDPSLFNFVDPTLRGYSEQSIEN